MKQLQLFLAFFRVGILGYGGGPSSIPLVHKEVVEKYKWMDDDDFSDVLALGNAMPGPIATKMAGYIGWRVGGLIGMINAVLATIIPTIILMILLLNVLNAYKDKAWVQGMANAVVPVVGVMLGVLTWDFIMKSKGALGWSVTIGIVIGSLIIIEILGIHPAIVIGGLLVYALVAKKKPVPEREVKAS
ncbi:chromate transporter [Bacillus sp. SCS-153A]|uniref:chromate transporter n=1 Tax=Rossellomorea sedimentorum TaxID=3115294 RepID=UPI00390671BE